MKVTNGFYVIEVKQLFVVGCSLKILPHELLSGKHVQSCCGFTLSLALSSRLIDIKSKSVPI